MSGGGDRKTPLDETGGIAYDVLKAEIAAKQK
jgi:hypothetical protein